MRFDEAVKSEGGTDVKLSLKANGDETMSMELDPGKLESGYDIIYALVIGAHHVFKSGGGDDVSFAAFMNQQVSNITGVKKH